MSKSVSSMSIEEKNALFEQLAICVKKHGLEKHLKVESYRETVCPLAAQSVQERKLIRVEKKFSADMKDKAKAFSAEAKQIVDGIEGAMINVTSSVNQGDQYDPIEGIVPINGGEPITLEHVPGEVWLIDFWATWCPPCQRPMQHNEDMLKKREADWGDKVKIIGISIDQTAEAVVKHVESKDWKRPIHYHRAKSNCSEVYGVRGVPNVMLIDTHGKIVFKGHPARRQDLEADFDALLKGEELEVAADGDGEAEEKPEEDNAEETKDPAACQAYIDQFKDEIAPGFQKDEEITNLAKNMPRAFCVMVYTEALNVETGKMKIDWKNFRVLQGPSDNVDKVKEKLDSALDNTKGYEIVLREQKL